LILLKMRIGLKFVKSEVILGTFRLYVFCAVSENSGLLTCDALLLNEWLQTFRRTVSHSSSRVKKFQKKREAVLLTNDATFSPSIYVIFDIVLMAATQNSSFMRWDAVWIVRYG
jgi:hypothetical protein